MDEARTNRFMEMSVEEMHEHPIDIDELSIDDLQLLRQMITVEYESCSGKKCEKCKSNRRCFVGQETSCYVIRDYILKRLVEKLLEEREQQTFQPKAKGTCEECRYLDKERVKGYCFCNFWHNMTQPHGHCYGFACKSDGEDVR